MLVFKLPSCLEAVISFQNCSWSSLGSCPSVSSTSSSGSAFIMSEVWIVLLSTQCITALVGGGGIQGWYDSRLGHNKGHL